MRRIIRTAVLSLALLAEVAGAQEPSKKDRLRWIREQYQAVEAGAGRSRPFSRPLNEFDTFLCYAEGRSVDGDRIIEALLRETDGETFDGVPNRPHEKILGFTPDEAASFLQDAYDALKACRSTE